MKKLTQEEFIEKCKEKHGDKYDYSLVEYNNSKSIINIYCKKHDLWFKQNAFAHSTGAASCKKCIGEIRGNINKGKKSSKKLTNEEVVERIKNNFGNNFDYSNVNYKNERTKIELICNRCGKTINIFPSRINFSVELCNHCSHINAQKNRTYNTEKFIMLAKLIHKDKYDYSLTKYINARTNVLIKCNNCKEIFNQNPRTHLEGHGCPKCSKTGKNTKTTEHFLKAAKLLHGEQFDYSLVNYYNNNTKIKIKCNKCGLLFEQKPRTHLEGKGCPNCRSSSGERKIYRILKENKIISKQQKTFNDLINPQTGKKLRYDFFIPSKNLLIEYNGLQHYKPIDFFGGVKSFKELQFRDKLKIDYAKKQGIELLVIRYDENIEEKLSTIF